MSCRLSSPDAPVRFNSLVAASPNSNRSSILMTSFSPPDGSERVEPEPAPGDEQGGREQHRDDTDEGELAPPEVDDARTGHQRPDADRGQGRQYGCDSRERRKDQADGG